MERTTPAIEEMGALSAPIKVDTAGNLHRTSPSVISYSACGHTILGLKHMAYPLQTHVHRRVPRFRLTDTTPAVLQFQDGRRTPGELQVISRAGGLLVLSSPLDQGSVVKLMFQTHRGPVLGTAEMLIPVTCTQQPFRFLALPECDQRTLQAAFQSGFYRNTDEEEWMEEFRAAIVNWNPYPRRRPLRVVLAALTLATLFLGSAIYILHFHLLK